PTGSVLYLLDIKGVALYSLTLSTLSLTLLATFTGESVNSLTALGVDFNRSPAIAYVTSQTSGNVYGVSVGTANQVIGSLGQIYYDNSGLQFAGVAVVYNAAQGTTRLYLTSATSAQGAANTVLSTIA